MPYYAPPKQGESDARREVLTLAQRFQLFAFPEDEIELIRLATLSMEDFAFVRQHRGGHNRLGIAVLMVYLRFPGRALGPAEKPHAPIIGIVAAKLGVTPAGWDVYATRDETRREHSFRGHVHRRATGAICRP